VEGNPAIMRGTGQGLLEFCERLAARGDIDPATARAYRSTAKKILETESTDLNDVNLRELDVDDLFVRFTKLNKPAYSEGSLKTYRSRFNQAVGMYLAWLDDDRGWKTGGRPAPKTAANGSAGSVSSSGVPLLTYDVPLRHDLIIRMTLPIDLTESDADRLCTFVRSLAFMSRAGKPETHEVEGDARDAESL